MDTNLISSLPSRVICLGEILYDCLANQIGQSLERVQSWTNYPGGAPANTACALVKLGTPAAFMGCVAEDSPAKALLQLLADTGVNTEGAFLAYNESASNNNQPPTTSNGALPDAPAGGAGVDRGTSTNNR